jgi:hypothetical protein
MANNFRKSKKYTLIVKVGGDDFKKWRANDLLKFVRFLDKSHCTWRWFNVFCNKSKQQIGNFTKKNPPSSPHI